MKSSETLLLVDIIKFSFYFLHHLLHWVELGTNCSSFCIVGIPSSVEVLELWTQGSDHRFV